MEEASSEASHTTQVLDFHEREFSAPGVFRYASEQERFFETH